MGDELNKQRLPQSLNMYIKLGDNEEQSTWRAT